MRQAILLSSAILGLCCCCSWGGFVDGAFQTLTTTDSVSADVFLSSMFGQQMTAPSAIRNFQGVRVEFPGFSNYYLRYNADKETVLDLIASMPASPSVELTSDAACERSSESLSGEIFALSDKELSDVEFWQPDQVQAKEYYTCLKFPWAHTVLFDQNSDAVYHVVHEVRE